VKRPGPAAAAPIRRDPALIPIGGREVRHWVYQLTIDQEVLQMVRKEAPPPPRGIGCFPRRGSPPDAKGLDKALVHDKDFVLYLSRAEVDFNEIVQWRILRTMHSRLTQSTMCPPTGKHWQALGFESEDPRIDLNAKGGLLHLVHLFLFLSNYPELLKAIYWASIGNFPLATVSMQITQRVVEALLLGKLSIVCKDYGVFETTCQLHAASLHLFYTKCQGKDAAQMQRAQVQAHRDVLMSLTKKPSRLLKDFEKAPKAIGAPPQDVPTDEY